MNKLWHLMYANNSQSQWIYTHDIRMMKYECIIFSLLLLFRFTDEIQNHVTDNIISSVIRNNRELFEI